MALYKDGNPVSGLNSIPRLTLAQYNALNVKPEFWVRTDAPESYKKLSADQVSYDSNNTVKDILDNKPDIVSYTGSLTTNANGYVTIGDLGIQGLDPYKVLNVIVYGNSANRYAKYYSYNYNFYIRVEDNSGQAISNETIKYTLIAYA